MNEEKEKYSVEDRISVIELGGIWFGIDILKSREVIPLPMVTPVPNTEEYMVGVFNLRGEIYPLVDISPILGMNLKESRNTDMVILLDGNNLTLGILADRIHGVRQVKKDQIKSPHGIVPKKMVEFVSGVVVDPPSEIYLLDIDRLFSSPAIRAYY